MRIFPLRGAFFIEFLLFSYFIFLLFLHVFDFFDFDLDIACFILSFACGCYAVSSVSVSAMTRLPYDTYYIYLDPYVR